MTADWEDFIGRLKKADKGDSIDFALCEKPLDRALWALDIAKKLGQRKLTAEWIALSIIDVEEISIKEESITNALKRAGDKVHRYYENRETYYEIMKPGREHLSALRHTDLVMVLYFEPDMRYTAKTLLMNQVFTGLIGEIKVVDPYCGERTLDVLASLKDRPVKVLTRLESLRERDRSKLLREIADFKTENPNVEFKNYPDTDIHDRYIISDDKVVLIGHSLKDLGTKESFAVTLSRENQNEIHDALNRNFTDRWNVSAII